MKALIDTNIVLDLFLNRNPFIVEAQAIWDANDQGLFEGYISAITPINLFYIGRKIKGKDEAWKAVRELVAAFRICLTDRAVLQDALTLAFSDYEDAVQHACATSTSLDAIVTRDLADYTKATIPVFSPSDFLKKLSTP